MGEAELERHLEMVRGTRQSVMRQSGRGREVEGRARGSAGKEERERQSGSGRVGEAERRRHCKRGRAGEAERGRQSGGGRAGEAAWKGRAEEAVRVGEAARER
jgi:hypothetical protein